MVAKNDRVVVSHSDTFGYDATGTVVSDRPSRNGYWSVLMDDPEGVSAGYPIRNYAEGHFTVVDPVSAVPEDETFEEFLEQFYMVEVKDDGEPVRFDSVESAGIYATGVKRGGSEVEVVEYVSKVVKTRRVIDSF
jgi:hypothetical protein